MPTLSIIRPDLIEPVRWLFRRDREPDTGQRRRPAVVELRERFGLNAKTAIAVIRIAADERAKYWADPT